MIPQRRIGHLLLLLAAGTLSTAAGTRTARAQLQFLEITIPPDFGFTPASVPPISTFEWGTLSGSADPDEFRFIMLNTAPFAGSYSATVNYIRNNPDSPDWSSWQPYLPPDVGTSWTTPPLEYGGYVFAVQGRDALGAAEDLDELRNVRRIRVSARTSGALLTVFGDLIDPITTVNTDTPLTEIDVEAGAGFHFCWTADASAYGGWVIGYRYGWDILDLDDPSQWDMAFTPLPTDTVCSVPKVFFFGQHTFHVEVIDNSGYKSRVPILMQIIPANPVNATTWGRVKALYRDETSP